MKKLNEKEWKVFPFIEIFDIKKGFYNKKPKTGGKGTVPFIGATEFNNGVTGFLTMQEIEYSSKTGDSNNVDIDKKIFDGRAIAVTNNGSVGHAFYQKSKFTCSHDINPLYLKDHFLNKNEAQFLIEMIESQGKLFQYARKWRPIRMIKSKILLPVNEHGDPDYEYMENYTKSIRDNLINRYKNFVKKQMEGLEYKEIPRLSEKEWKVFILGDILNVAGTKTTAPTDLIEYGKVPRITCSAINNGLDNFYSNEATEKANVLTVDSATIGAIFYQPHSFIATDHVEIIYKENGFDATEALFMKTAIHNSTGEKYQYGYKFSQARIKKQKVLLPVNEHGDPDYEYMEQYSKNILFKKYNKYLKFIEKM